MQRNCDGGKNSTYLRTTEHLRTRYFSCTINFNLTYLVMFFEHIISKRTPLILSANYLCRKIIYVVDNYNAVDA
jgi:hypothetical protein